MGMSQAQGMSCLQQPLHTYLRSLRLKLGLTQRQVANLAQIDPRRLSAYENGTRRAGPAQLARLAHVLGTSLEELLPHPPVWQGRSRRDAWFRDRHFFAPKFDRTGDQRLATAVATYGKGIQELLERCSPTARDFLALTAGDSAPEWAFQLQLLASTSEPSRASPLGIQFRRHTVVDPCTGACVGDCRVPCLIGALNSTRYILIPKVQVRTLARPQTPYTLDFLCGVREPGRPIAHVNVEIDGSGHNPRFDRERTRALALHTIRLSQTEVGASTTVDLFHARLLPFVSYGRTA